MNNRVMGNLVITALALSALSSGLASYTFYKYQSPALSDEAFAVRVEKGINDFIKKQQDTQQAAQDAAENNSVPVEVSVDDDPVKGDKNAPVTIVEFSDFECPFCSRFTLQTLPQIISEYLDKGKVRLIFRDYPLDFHANAKPAALAANCAREQGGDEMYYKFHDKIFADQKALSPESLKKWAVELGLKSSQFDSCLDSKKFEEEVDKDFAQGQSYGVTGTPAFFVNGRKLTGARPFDDFKKIIDEELGKAGK